MIAVAVTISDVGGMYGCKVMVKVVVNEQDSVVKLGTGFGFVNVEYGVEYLVYVVELFETLY